MEFDNFVKKKKKIISVSCKWSLMETDLNKNYSSFTLCCKSQGKHNSFAAVFNKKTWQSFNKFHNCSILNFILKKLKIAFSFIERLISHLQKNIRFPLDLTEC